MLSREEYEALTQRVVATRQRWLDHVTDMMAQGKPQEDILRALEREREQMTLGSGSENLQGYALAVAKLTWAPEPLLKFPTSSGRWML